MISIGNDIVALSAINSQRTNDIRFHSKFVTKAELALHQIATIAALPFESFVWLLWSVKESAYKYQKRLYPELLFSPAKIIVHDIDIHDNHSYITVIDTWESNFLDRDFVHGRVHIGESKLYFKTIVTDKLIATIVCSEPSFQNIHWGIQKTETRNNEDQSTSVRTFLLNRLQNVYPNADLSIDKSAIGYPVLNYNPKATALLISFAHHGEYISYCFGTSAEI